MTRKNFTAQVKLTAAASTDSLERKFSLADGALPQLTAAPSPVALPPVSTVIRETFSMLKSDFESIDEIRSRAARCGHIANKSEIVRAGLWHLQELSEDELILVIGKVEKLLPGKRR